MKESQNYWRKYPNLRGNYIHPDAWIAENVEIGFNNYIEAGAVIGAAGHFRGISPKDMNGKIVIGDGNRIGANTTIHYGKDGVTKIGDRNMIMSGVNIGHDVEIGNDVEICPQCLLAGYSKVGDRTKIKQGSHVNTFIKIGSDNFIWSGSIVTRDTNDGETLKGIPAKVLQIEK